MQRLAISPRPDWQEKVRSVGMTYHTMDGETYWDESACYRFTSGEIDVLEGATEELHRLCLQAVEQVIRRDRFASLGIPREFVPLIVRSWEMKEPSLYGRFDLAYDGSGEPKLLEYNADTPTSLLEASVVQWFWLKDNFPRADQFNSIHEKLVAFWQKWPQPRPGTMHFACSGGSEEDLGNTEYLMDTALQGGMAVRHLPVEEIGWDGSSLVGLEDEPIEALFKLYPWEWLVREVFGPHLIDLPLRVVEPPWKMILSNKGILPILWELFGGHPNLLPASFSRDDMRGDFVRKPLFSREGSNVTIHRGRGVIETPGSYGAEGWICQEYRPLPVFDGNHAVIGSWVVGGEPAGIGIREDRGPVTTNASRFVPHFFEEN